MEPLNYRIIVAVLLLIFVGHRGFYTKQAEKLGQEVLTRPESHPAEKIANFLALPAFLSTFIYLFAPTWLSWFSFSWPEWVRWIGVVLALVGFGLLQWAQMTLGRNWSDTPQFMEGQQLVKSGPYAWVRHPIYTAFLLILSSILFISTNWLVGGLWVVMTVLAVWARVQVEEGLMMSQFGARYEQYCQQTGRLFPYL